MIEQPGEKTAFSSRIGSGMTVMAWIIMLGLLTYYFSDVLQEQVNPNEKVATAVGPDNLQVTLLQNRQGQYVASGEINGVKSIFIVDTGATMVSVPGHLARQMRLKRGPEMVVVTANGEIPVYATLLNEIKLGDITMHGIRASINPFMREDFILLGMSFLKHLEITQRNDQLILRQYK